MTSPVKFIFSLILIISHMLAAIPSWSETSQAAPETVAPPACSLVRTGDIQKNELATADPPAPYAIGNSFSRALQRYSGINWMSERIAGKVASMVLSRKSGGKADVQIKTYSFTDLLAGKMKSIDITIENARTKELKLGNLRVNSTGPVWFAPRSTKKHGKGLQKPILLDIRANIPLTDLENALVSEDIASRLTGLKLDIPGLGGEQLQIIDPSIKSSGNKIIIHSELIVKNGQSGTGLPISLTTRPRVDKNGDIVLSELEVESSYIEDPQSFACFLGDLINPVVRSSRYDRKTSAFRFTDIDLDEKELRGKLRVLLAPKVN